MRALIVRAQIVGAQIVRALIVSRCRCFTNAIAVPAVVLITAVAEI